MSKLWQETNWYAVESKPHREDLAALNLRLLGLEVLLPKVWQDRLMWGVKRPVLKPLFPRYLFSHFCPTLHLHSINYARGVKQVIGIGEWLQPVDELIISEIRSRMINDQIVELEAHSFVRGQRVTVGSGPLVGLQGIFDQETGEQERVVILLEALNYRARLLIERQSLKAAV